VPNPESTTLSPLATEDDTTSRTEFTIRATSAGFDFVRAATCSTSWLLFTFATSCDEAT